MSSKTEIPSPTRTLAELIASATYAQLPKNVVNSAKRYIQDSIANQIGGLRLAPSKIIVDMFEGMGGKRESTILATGKRVPCLHAVYVNAALNNMLDFDDCYFYASHPGATTVPPALSLGETLGSSGKEVINAVVLGYEVSLRVGDAIRSTPQRFNTVWGMATWQIFGAVTVAAKLLRLDASRVADALGHAGMSAPVPFSHKEGIEPEDRPFGWLKNNFGWTAMGGVLAAQLASKGYRGNRTIFDGAKGFWVMAGSDRWDSDRLTSGLGKEYLMPMTGFKPYACCRWTHTTIAAVEEIIKSRPINPQRIRSIRVNSTTPLCDTFGLRKPADVIDAQFSVPPLIALTLAGHSPSAGIDFDNMSTKLVRDLILKVKLVAAADADLSFHGKRQMPSTVTIEMLDGNSYQATKSIATGESDIPLTDKDLDSKFLMITTPIIGERKAKRILAQVKHLEEVENIGQVIRRAAG